MIIFQKIYNQLFKIETRYDNYLLPEKLVFNEYKNEFLTRRFLVKQ